MTQFQIGKAGITPGVLQSLKTYFKNNKVVRISVLKNAVRDKDKVREMAEEIKTKMEGNFDYRIIGFKIILKRRGVKK